MLPRTSSIFAFGANIMPNNQSTNSDSNSRIPQIFYMINVIVFKMRGKSSFFLNSKHPLPLILVYHKSFFLTEIILILVLSQYKDPVTSNSYNFYSNCHSTCGFCMVNVIVLGGGDSVDFLSKYPYFCISHVLTT